MAASGTSMATPFVTGGAALLMQWGITDGNDPFLYGEKVKAYFIKGARRIGSGGGISESGDWVGDAVCGGELAGVI